VRDSSDADCSLLYERKYGALDAAYTDSGRYSSSAKEGWSLPFRNGRPKSITPKETGVLQRYVSTTVRDVETGRESWKDGGLLRNQEPGGTSLEICGLEVVDLTRKCWRCTARTIHCPICSARSCLCAYLTDEKTPAFLGALQADAELVQEVASRWNTRKSNSDVIFSTTTLASCRGPGRPLPDGPRRRRGSTKVDDG